MVISRGFFANEVEVLTELHAEFGNERAHRLLVGVYWWWGNAYRLSRLLLSGEEIRCLI